MSGRVPEPGPGPERVDGPPRSRRAAREAAATGALSVVPPARSSNEERSHETLRGDGSADSSPVLVSSPGRSTTDGASSGRATATAVRTAPVPAWQPKTAKLSRAALPPVPPGLKAVGWVLVGAAVVGLLFAVDALAPQVFSTPIPTRLQDGLTLALSVLVESLPFVVLGVLLSIIVQVWVPASVLHRWMPRRAWARRLVLSLLGMLVPVCECGNVPFARGLLMRGFAVPETMTFLIAAPIVNPIVIISTNQAFGLSDGILVARILGGFAVANLIGWLYSRHPDPDALLTERFAATCEIVRHEEGGRGRRSLAQFVVELRAVMPALVIGSVLAGAVQVVVPRDALLAIGSNPALSIVAMMALAIVVAICSNVDAFFALSFASTFTPGSIVAFLIVGPIVDVKMIALMRTTFRTPAIVGVVVIVLLFSFALASAVNLLA